MNGLVFAGGSCMLNLGHKFLVILIFASSLSVKAENNTCAKSGSAPKSFLVNAKNIKTSPTSKALLSLPPVDVEFINFPTIKTAIVGDRIPIGKAGSNQAYYLIEKTKDTWRAHVSEKVFDIDSDPTWIISALGPKLAKFLGFGLINYKTMIVPNAERFNFKILQLNKLLRQAGLEEIPFSFNSGGKLTEEDKALGIGKAEAFIRDFTYEHRFPIVRNELVHDVAHHALNVLMTLPQMKPLLQRYDVALRFADFIRKQTVEHSEKFEVLSDRKMRDAFFNLYFQYLSRDIDNLSGLIPVNILGKNSRETASDNFTYYRFFNHHLGPAFGKYGGTEGQVQSFSLYEVSDWLRHMNHKMIFILSRSVSDADFGVNYFLSRTYQYKERRLLKNKNELLAYELNQLHRMFSPDLKDLDSVGLVLYDSRFNVIGGIAAKEPPVESYFRRIDEFKEVIGDRAF